MLAQIEQQGVNCPNQAREKKNMLQLGGSPLCGCAVNVFNELPHSPKSVSWAVFHHARPAMILIS
jgi:hypothetical protein